MDEYMNKIIKLLNVCKGNTELKDSDITFSNSWDETGHHLRIDLSLSVNLSQIDRAAAYDIEEIIGG